MNEELDLSPVGGLNVFALLDSVVSVGSSSLAAEVATIFIWGVKVSGKIAHMRFARKVFRFNVRFGERLLQSVAAKKTRESSEIDFVACIGAALKWKHVKNDEDLTRTGCVHDHAGEKITENTPSGRPLV